MKKCICILVLCALVFSGLWADIAPKFTGWKQAETEHFRFVFEEASREAAEAYAEIADEAYAKVAKEYGLPPDKILVYVIARTNTINAFTTLPPLSIIMYTTPFLIPDFTYRDDWVKYVFTHELIHTANMGFENKDTTLSKLFGDYFSIMDMQMLNGWEVEGLTTVLETELSDAGRGRSPYFELLYKAPAMEGCLISYDEIGLDAEPPAGQIYVYGYLMMKSIADRWGLDTLADLERNRDLFSTYDDALLGITGVTAQDLWRDVKIALTKKYAQERSIPEGKIISSRSDYTYKPAVILDDGTIIALKKTDGSLSVVSLDPSQKNGQTSFDALKGGDADVKETVLFKASVPDAYSVTADGNGRVYACLAVQRGDRAPGLETSYPLFSWDKENGLQQLTKDGSSYFQPSVSWDGRTLVALEQKGMKMRLVQIDVQSGAVTPLLDDAAYDFAMPAVNEDGSQVAVLRVGGGRAAVSLFDMKNAGHGASDASVLTIVANGTGKIVDPAYPTWNGDTLTYCSNERGRLEVFEVTLDEEGAYVSTPVVSDPIGALWAYKTGRGIYYGSYASNGYVVKMKPYTEWGIVPEWEGPSMPGEKITLNWINEDYRGYEPYANADKWESFSTRPMELYDNAANLGEPVTVLQNERKYVQLPATLMRLPMVLVAELPGKKYAFGIGGMYVGMSTQLMGRTMVAEADAEFYPQIMNFGGDAGIETEIHNSVLDLFVSRQLGMKGSKFAENNQILVGFTHPFYNRSTPVSDWLVSSITTAVGTLLRTDSEAFAVNDKVAVTYGLSGAVGLGVVGDTWNDSLTNGIRVDSSAVALLNWDDTVNKLYCGAEAEVEMLFGDGESFAGFYLQGRYLDAPDTLVIGSSTMKHAGNKVDAANPLNVVARFESVSITNGLRVNLYEEGLCSLTKAGAFVFDDILATGLECGMGFGNNSLAAGITANYSLNSEKFTFGKFYFTIKMNFLRM